MTCIFGSSGKIGTLFKSIFPDAQCPHHTNPSFKPCKLYIFCNHYRGDFSRITKFTHQMLAIIEDVPDVTIINIASDAEIIPIPTRLKYGQLKKELRYDLEKRRNRIINIFFPYVTSYNTYDLYMKLAAIDFRRDFYYFSDLSNLVRPLWSTIKPLKISSDVNWNEALYCHKDSFNSEIIDNPVLYESVRLKIEDAYRIDLIPHSELHLGMLSWQLSFSGDKKQGKMHTDMKRCLFGNLFRAILCIENDTDYKILIDDMTYDMHVNDIIIIPDGVRHQPLKTTYGSRKIIVLDFFTSKIPNFFMILLFYIFNNLKFLGLEV
jgi:hypothetical protein